MLAGKPIFMLFMITYIIGIKRVSEYFGWEAPTWQKSLLLFAVPLILRRLHIYFSSKGISMSPEAKDFYKVFNKGNLEEIKTYINLKFKGDCSKLVNLYFYTGTHCLLMAIQEKNIELIEYLIKGGFPVDHKDIKTDETALYRAVHFNFYEIVELLVNKYNASIYNRNKYPGLNCFELAIYRKKHLLIDFFMKKGLKYNREVHEKAFVLNKFMKWDDVSLEIKQVVCKHKLFNLRLPFLQDVEAKEKFTVIHQNKKLNRQLDSLR